MKHSLAGSWSERSPPDEPLEQRCPQGVEIRSGIHDGKLKLLGWHVLERTDAVVVLGDPLAKSFIQCDSDSKIDELWPVGGGNDVARFDVTVNHPASVDVTQG